MHASASVRLLVEEVETIPLSRLDANMDLCSAKRLEGGECIDDPGFDEVVRPLPKTRM